MGRHQLVVLLQTCRGQHAMKNINSMRLSSVFCGNNDSSTPGCGLTFKAHVAGVESDKSGLSHVAGEVLSKAFWVGGGEREHLFVHWQRGEDPAEETSGGGGLNYAFM